MPPIEAWWPNELDYAGPEHLDASYVAGYERKAAFDPAPDVAALRALGLDERSTILDLGTGSGVFASAVAPHCAQVIAADVSPAMLAAIRARAPANVTVVHAGLLSYEHRGPPLEFVYSRNVFHQIPDFWKAIALDRLRGVLAPGAVLLLRDLVYDFAPREAPAIFDRWMANAVTDASVGYTADDFATHIRTEFSTFGWIFEGMLERAGFTIVERDYRARIYASYTCRASTT